jgi:cell division protein FtsB
MITPITIPLIYLLTGIPLIAILMVRLFFKNYWLAYFRKHSDSTAEYYQAEAEKLASTGQALKENVQKLENDVDLLWMQLLQWREFAEENRSFLHGILPSVENDSFHKLAAELDRRFAYLSEISERDRQQYMQILRQKEDYEAEFNMVITKIANKFSGMTLGEKADETPILYSNREN